MNVFECITTEEGNGASEFRLATDRGSFIITGFLSFNCEEWTIDSDYYYYHELDQQAEIHSLDKIEEVRQALLFWCENNLESLEYFK